MNKVKLLKLSVEDVYTESMNSFEMHRFSPEQITPIERSHDVVFHPTAQIRTRVMPISRWFKARDGDRSETLFTTDISNIEEWIPMFNEQLGIAGDVLVNELASSQKENTRLYRDLAKCKDKLKVYQEMTFWQRLKFLFNNN